MPKRLNFSNPNFESGSFFNIEQLELPTNLEDGETGISAIDAGRKIYNTIMAARAEAELYKQEALKCRERSFVDTLTGCYNRNFFEKFKAENFDSERDHNKLALIFADLNSLKAINDSIGHGAGDSMIKYTADYLKHNYRPNDLVIRLGGDEFLVICRNDGSSSYNFEDIIDIDRRQAAKLPNESSHRDLVYCSERNYRPDFSYGIAIYDKELDDDLEDTLVRADQSMYEQKKHQKAVKNLGSSAMSNRMLMPGKQDSLIDNSNRIYFTQMR